MDDARPEDVVPAAWRGGSIEARVAWCEAAIEKMAAKINGDRGKCEERRFVTDDEVFINGCRNRLTHGFSVSLDEQRKLFELASGEILGRGYRCRTCDGTGEDGPVDECSDCNGFGYVGYNAGVPR